MEKEALYSILLAIVLVAGIFQAMQISRINGDLGNLQAKASSLALQAQGAASAPQAAQAAAPSKAPAPKPAPYKGINGYSSQVGGC